MPSTLTAEQIIERAAEATHLVDLGGQHVVTAVETAAVGLAGGEYPKPVITGALNQLHHLLVGRLRYVEDQHRFPIDQEQVEAPFVIIGPARAGTTLVQSASPLTPAPVACGSGRCASRPRPPGRRATTPTVSPEPARRSASGSRRSPTSWPCTPTSTTGADRSWRTTPSLSSGSGARRPCRPTRSRCHSWPLPTHRPSTRPAAGCCNSSSTGHRRGGGRSKGPTTRTGWRPSVRLPRRPDHLEPPRSGPGVPLDHADSRRRPRRPERRAHRPTGVGAHGAGQLGQPIKEAMDDPATNDGQVFHLHYSDLMGDQAACSPHLPALRSPLRSRLRGAIRAWLADPANRPTDTVVSSSHPRSSGSPPPRSTKSSPSTSSATASKRRPGSPDADRVSEPPVASEAC